MGSFAAKRQKAQNQKFHINLSHQSVHLNLNVCLRKLTQAIREKRESEIMPQKHPKFFKKSV